MKNLSILGFMLDFRSNASKTFKKVRKSIVDLTAYMNKSSKSWGKVFKNFTSMVVNNTKSIVMWGEIMRKTGPKVQDVISEIGDKFGGVAGIIADTLARPAALFGALGAKAVSMGLAMENSMIAVQRETSLTMEEFKKYEKLMNKVSGSLKVPLSQLQSLVKTFTAANIPIENYNELMEAAVGMNRATGIETALFGRQIVRLARDFNMTGKQVREFYNYLYGTAKASALPLAELAENVESLTRVVSEYMPDNFEKGMKDITAIFATTADLFDDNMGFVQKFFASAFDVQSNEYVQMRNLAAKAGVDVAASFEEGMKSRDMKKAFTALLKGIKSLGTDTGAMQQIRQVFQEVFGISVKNARQFQKINEELLRAVELSGDFANSTNQLTKETRDMATTTERWHKLWGQIERALLPLGESILAIASPLLDIITSIATSVSNWVNSLSEGQKTLLGISTIAGVIAGFWSTFALIGGMLLARLTPILNIFTKLFDIVKNFSSLSTVVGGAFSKIASILSFVWTLAKNIFGVFSRLAVPILAVLSILYVVDKVLKGIFGGGIMDAFLGALKIVGNIVMWIGKLIEGIIEVVVSAIDWTINAVKFILDKIADTFLTVVGKGWLWDSNPETPSLTESVVSSRQLDISDNNSTATLTDTPTSLNTQQIASVSQQDVDWRKEFGTEDIIQALYNTNKLLLEKLGSMQNNGIPAVAPNYSHTRLTGPSLGGPR